jgi:hypothetical protein
VVGNVIDPTVVVVAGVPPDAMKDIESVVGRTVPTVIVTDALVYTGIVGELIDTTFGGRPTSCASPKASVRSAPPSEVTEPSEPPSPGRL